MIPTSETTELPRRDRACLLDPHRRYDTSRLSWTSLLLDWNVRSRKSRGATNTTWRLLDRVLRSQQVPEKDRKPAEDWKQKFSTTADTRSWPVLLRRAGGSSSRPTGHEKETCSSWTRVGQQRPSLRHTTRIPRRRAARRLLPNYLQYLGKSRIDGRSPAIIFRGKQSLGLDKGPITGQTERTAKPPKQKEEENPIGLNPSNRSGGFTYTNNFVNKKSKKKEV